MRTGRLLAIVIAALGTTLLSGLLTVAPASAREPDVTIVTAATISHVQRLSRLLRYQDPSVLRIEDYSQSPQGRYVYAFQFADLDELPYAVCSLSRNGRRIAAGTCEDLSSAYNGIELPVSGTYLLRVNGAPVRSFVFRKPTAVPPALGPAPCTITSVTPGALTSDGGQVFTLSTTGTCTDGQWSYTAEYPRGGMAYSVFAPGKDGTVTISAISPSAATTRLTFEFLPNGYRILTAYTLQSTQGSPTWTPVPSAAGY